MISALVIEWSIILQFFFESLVTSDPEFAFGKGVDMLALTNALFCAGAVMISYGGFLGKATPTQMLVVGILEPMFYWLNIYITISKLEVIDVGTIFSLNGPLTVRWRHDNPYLWLLLWYVILRDF